LLLAPRFANQVDNDSDTALLLSKLDVLLRGCVAELQQKK
jgi:hypothetical protein